MEEDLKNKLTEIENDIKELKTLTIESGTDIDSIVKSQLDLLNQIHKSNKSARANLKKELRQLQGLIVVVIAAVVFFFGMEDKGKRDQLIVDHIKEIATAGLALAGGYRVFNAKEEENREREDDIS